jgi:type I restriction enzyme M protein
LNLVLTWKRQQSCRIVGKRAGKFPKDGGEENMIGAIAGDIAGSRFEWDRIKTKEFEFFAKNCFFTDDTVMTLAVCDALMKAENPADLPKAAVRSMRSLAMKYPKRGYGGNFALWLESDDPKPYWSYGNGSAMRVSGCGWAGRTIEEVRALSKAVTAVTHNHPEGLKGAEATAVAIFLARSGKTMPEIRRYMTEHYYAADSTLDEIRPTYAFYESCQRTVPQALVAFYESTSFEDAVRNAVSLGGDSDTIGAITGSIAEAYYGVPDALRKKALSYLTADLREIVRKFEQKFDARKTAKA